MRKTEKIFVVGLMATMLLIALAPNVSANPSWWDGNWTKRKSIENVAGNDNISIIIPYDSDMRADYGDLRFLENETTGVLTYFIENYTASNAYVSIHRTDFSDNSIFMYYGNPSVTTTSLTWTGKIILGAKNIPAGWVQEPTIVNVFPRGFGTFGSTGGSTSHSHSFSGTTAMTYDYPVGLSTGAIVSEDPHNHAFSGTTSTDSSIPLYFDVIFVKKENFLPSQIDNNFVLFLNNLPSGYTSVGTENSYIRGADAYGTSGGTSTHSHTAGASTGNPSAETPSGIPSGSSSYPHYQHNHSFSTVSDNVANNPPYLDVIVACSNSTVNLPSGTIAFFDNLPPLGWDILTSADQRFFRIRPAYAGAGGVASHSHIVSGSTGAPSATTNNLSASGTGHGSLATHTHSVSFTTGTTEVLPPFVNVIVGLRKASSSVTIGSEESCPPNPPTSLLCEGLTNPTHIMDTTPEFSAIGTDNNHDNMNYYALQVDNDLDFSSTIYNKSKTSITSFDNGVRCSDISYENADLVRGTTYYWRIKFWDNVNNEGAWSTETATFKINQLPTAPSGITDLGMNLTDHTPEISWTKGTDADGDTVYTYIYMDANATPTTLENSTTGTKENIGENSITLVDGTTYYYRLRSWDGYEWSTSYSSTDTFRMNSLPTVPTSFTNLGMNLTDHTPEVSWTKGTDAEGDTVTTYVYCDANATPTTQENNTTGTSENLGENSITFTDGTTYYYRLRSWDGYEWSTSYSSTDTFRMNSLPTTPTTLTLNSPKVGEVLTATGSGSTDAEGDGITYYYRFYNVTDAVTRQDYSTDNSYAIQAADAHDNIRVYTKAYDGYEYSGEFENSIMVTNTPPTIPTGLVLNSPKVNENYTAAASGSTDADGDSITYYYEFYNYTDAAERKAYSTDNFYTVAVSDAHDNIGVHVKAFDGYENSPVFENSVIVSNTQPTAPTLYTNLAVENDNTPYIEWVRGTDVDGDTVWTYIYMDDDPAPTTLESSTTDNNDDIGENNALVAGNIYYYRLRSWDGYEFSAAYSGIDVFGISLPSTTTTVTTTAAAPPSEEIVTVAAPSPPLFTMVGFALPAFQVLGNVIPLWFPVVIAGVYGWAKKRKIIVAGCAFMLVAIWVFGARLTNVLLPSPLTPSTAALLTPVFSAFGKLVPLWVPIAVVAMWGWAKGKKEVALACLGMLIFLFLFGARIL